MLLRICYAWGARVQLDSIAVALRPRNPWEAIDLGFGMVRTWWKSIMGAWLAVVLPVSVIIYLLCWKAPWLASLLMWWLKPAFDRIPLFVLSRAAFGDTPDIRQTLKGVLPLWRKSLLWDLTLGRVDMARSFNMPVRDLEGLRGKARRLRLKVLQKQTRNGAVWLTLVCINLEMVLNFALLALLLLLLPQTMQGDFFSRLFAADQSLWLQMMTYGIYLLVLTTMEPFYVGAGFALYLNRRTVLEGWDIEIAFRRIAERQQTLNKVTLPAAVLMMVGLMIGGMLGVPGPALAAETAVMSAPIKVLVMPESPKQLKKQIAQVLQQPEFQTDKIEKQWKYVGKKTQPSQPQADSDWVKFLAGIVPGLAGFVEGLLWLLLAGVIVWLYFKREHWLGWFDPKVTATPFTPTQSLFGLDLMPESLPKNLTEEAWNLWQADQARAALSLLYRGALARWVARDKVVLGANATEGDCIRLFRATAPKDSGDYFYQLTQAWLNTAYAQRQPRTEDMQQLCHGWDIHFPLTP